MDLWTKTGHDLLADRHAAEMVFVRSTYRGLSPANNSEGVIPYYQSDRALPFSDVLGLRAAMRGKVGGRCDVTQMQSLCAC